MKLPQAFIERMKHNLGASEYNLFEEALDDDIPVSIRVNRAKLIAELPYEKINWCRSGYFLDKRPIFASDPLWHAGAYYVQEASSMLLENVFNAAIEVLDGPLKILDLCAAPGGKSTHIASLCRTDDILVCNEVIRSRVAVLTENLRKQGYANTIICSADSSEFAKLGEIFDIILIDAPCSGEGLFRKDKDAVNEWSEENIKTCGLRQNRILDTIPKCLKPGGILIYSTCTYNPGENEDQLERLCSDNAFEALSFKVNGQEYNSYQCYPHRFRGEGFFIGMLRKKNSSSSILAKKAKGLIKEVKALKEWTEVISEDLAVYMFEDRLLTGSSEIFRFQNECLSGIYCYSIACELGTLKDKLFLPSEYLPFSLLLNKEHFPKIELEQSEAIQYLSKNPLPYKGSERGYTLLQFKNTTIGFGKFAGNRINNLFPAEWKLRKQPDSTAYFTLSN